jgi:hypothetical protein
MKILLTGLNTIEALQMLKRGFKIASETSWETTEYVCLSGLCLQDETGNITSMHPILANLEGTWRIGE